MADVGHEIASHRVGSALLGDIAYESCHAEDVAVAQDRTSFYLEEPARLGV